MGSKAVRLSSDVGCFSRLFEDSFKIVWGHHHFLHGLFVGFFIVSNAQQFCLLGCLGRARRFVGACGR